MNVVPRLAWIVAFVAVSVSTCHVAAEEAVNYRRDIQPILANRCFQCHGPDEAARQGGLRLDQREAAMTGGESAGPALVPDKPEDSALVARIESADESLRMPPVEEENAVTPAELELLKTWIRQGAPYARHWAFEPPVQAALPESSGSQPPHPVDAFIQAKLQTAGLAPSPPAEPETLCRRLYLDIIGLPPSPAQIEAFRDRAVQTGLRQAAAELADQLLQDPQFGQKWARQWLDVARYADSNGYEKDLPREQWIWRDWVVNAYNRDQPYNTFVLEQIAGDLLPNATLQQRVATGFLRNGLINEEGAIVPEQFRMEAMFDRMDVLGTGILGLSLKCGQCHSHKFDPISQTEYYQVFSYLNNTYEAQSWVYAPEQEQKIAEIHSALAAAESRVKQTIPDWESRLAAWEAAELARESQTPWTLIEAEDLHSSTELNHPTMLEDKSILTLGHRTISGDVHMIAAPAMNNATGLRLEILRHGDLPYTGPGRSFLGTWAITEFTVEAKKPGTDTWEKIKLVNATADFEEPQHAMEPEWANASSDKDNKRTCGPASLMVDGDNLTAWRADRGRGRRNTDSVAVMQFEQPLTLPEGTKLKIAIVTNHGGDDNGPKNTQVGRFRVAFTTAASASAAPVPYAAIRAMQIPAADRSPAEQAEIMSAWRATVPELKPLEDEINALWAQYPEAATNVLHLAERSKEMVRPTFRLERGAWDKPAERVQPGTIAALNPFPAGVTAPGDRLALAQWLVDRSSPLAARVEVNRVWQAIFGVGLQETAEDFGTRASEPSHVELLDWLAVDFMDHGWSRKQLIRTLVTSATYQQSSRVTPEQLEKDPANRLLARGPRFRAEAETVRDIALSAAGLLSVRAGGPSVYPPVPENVLEFNYFRPAYWIPPQGPDRYCRSLYLFRKRSMPDPALSTFDAPNGDATCARRVRSNSPLASLTTMNETVFVEAARALALRVLKEGGTTDPERIDYAYRLCTGRMATPAEREALISLLASRRKQIADGWLSARELTTGDPARLPELPPGTTPQDAAAWTIAARVLLNLDETITKG